uniref:ATP-dependent RNA helicase n=1 Tax=Globodera pallida TaxID=36090 RepID=A0A183CE28_GLOPA
MVKIDEQISSGISKDPLSLVDPIIKDHFLNNLKHKQLAPVQDVFDKETFYKFVLLVLVVSVLFVFLMVKVFKVRVRDYPARDVLRERPRRDWRPANPFQFPWQISANGDGEAAAKQRHVCTLRYMLANFDCVVQAPTGSGKSLAFMLPALQILVQKKLTNVAEDPKVPSEHLCRICALVVAPGRDLVVQLWHLFSPLCKKLGLNALKLHGAGGERKKSAQNPKKHMKGQCVLICTPGRFENFLEKEPELKKYLKHLEVLVIDEADRYSDRESMSSLTTLLAALPKQRRTALFSATQSAGIEQLLRFGLRNPTRLHVSADTGEVCTDSTGFDVATSNDQQNGETEEGHQTKGGVVPTELSIFYTCVPAELKLLALVKFLRSQKRAKVLIFVSNASQAEYFSLIVPQLLKKDGTDSAGAKERPVLSLHRKMEQKRGKVLELFRSTDRCVLFTTDLLARGIDVPKIDWVLHFDIPKLSRVFIHRCGRSARMGRAGRSLLLLMPEEEAYVQFMHTSAGVSMEQCQIETLTEERAVQLRERVQRQSIEDRKILELGSSAFVSYIEAYNRHDCQIICKVKDLNIVGVAVRGSKLIEI